MNLPKDKVTEIFYFADNFCKEFYKAIEIELGLIDNREWVMKDRRDCIDSKPGVNRIKQFFLRLRVYSA